MKLLTKVKMKMTVMLTLTMTTAKMMMMRRRMMRVMIAQYCLFLQSYVIAAVPFATTLARRRLDMFWT